MAFRRFRARPRRSPIAKRWTGDFSDAINTLAADTTGFLPVCTAQDYAQSPTLEAGGVTLARIRGTLSLRSTAANLTLVHAAFSLIETGAPVPEPATFANFIDGNLLWYGQFMAPGSGDPPLNFELDIKAKRRLRTSEIIFSIRPVATAIVYIVSGRCLLLGG